MSPAGIVMFYGSEDPETAIAEIDDKPELGISVATFRTTREALILDLTTLPRRLRFFEQQSDSDYRNRYAIDFLHDFVQKLAAKVEPGEREYIDYVPTQVVTEYFRTTFRRNEKVLDGVFYASAQRSGGRSLVLFADQSNIVLNADQIKELSSSGRHEDWLLRHRQEKAWLELVTSKIVRLPETAARTGERRNKSYLSSLLRWRVPAILRRLLPKVLVRTREGEQRQPCDCTQDRAFGKK